MRREFLRLGAGPGFAPGDTKSRYLPDTAFDTEHVNARFRSTSDTAARRIRLGIDLEPPKPVKA